MKIQLLIHFCLVWTFLILIFPSKAQTDLDAKPPTLQVGLDGFSFAKGSLDAQLIMEIVAEKQQELKIKAIQHVFLSKVEDAGGTVYTFVDNVVRQLVFEPDPQVRTKKIIENSVNLVFTSAFLNYYLSTLEKDSTSREQLIKFAKIFNNILNSDSLNNKDTLELSDFFSKEVRPRIFYEDKKAVQFIALLLDMCSKAIREDAKLKQLGLMQIAYSETYEYLNLYNKWRNDSISINQKIQPNIIQKIILNENQIHLLRDSPKVIEKNATVLLAESIFIDIKYKLRNITDYIGAVNYLVEQKTFRFNQVESINERFFKNDIDSLHNHLDSINKNLKEIIKAHENELKQNKPVLTTLQGTNLILQNQDDALIEDIKTLVKMYFYIDKASRMISKTIKEKSSKDHIKTYSDILYTLNADFIPILQNQSFRSTELIEITTKLQTFNEALFDTIAIKNPVLHKQLKNIPDFLQLVSKLYQFDKGNTISDYMKFLDEIGTTFPSDNIRNSLSTVLKFVKDYSVIERNEKDKEVLSFNVESFLHKLQTVKPYKRKLVQFNFTVGVNNAIFFDDLILTDESISRNLSFVGEKIGVKLIAWDWAFSWTRNPGETYKTSKVPFWNNTKYIRKRAPREPIVSNLHVLAYGSGILYNLVNTKTQKEFNMPIIGIGPGVTFYNGLDFNISYGVPILPDRPISTDYSFWNVGFDIHFIEYYQRLAEKRRNNQTQKRLVEAQKH